ncbi:signal peptidase I [Coxiella endosymbiont of Amblyomma sculptum]|uniref:signal peptidase I n=1 Tax=Coxiella endosymbiont of Amblyomma sculptum TaxID=2487929 RepID=UPI00132E9252|nr:signal peptidase I [Coxiella endosymbiont of Amblyomma sculptum]QHG92293.1 signal peptidase I [Coxiella endosymbiont of Amblyomma sculptum]
MIFDFSFYLTIAMILTGTAVCFDFLFLRKRKCSKSVSILLRYSKIFFPTLLIVWIVRSFIIQPYYVLTGSLEPTIMPGDFIAVEQFSYGLRLPVINKKVLPVGKPERGQIILFQWPKNPGIIFVKRVIGLPGDHVVYKNKQLYINGKRQKQKLLYTVNNTDIWEKFLYPVVFVKEEELYGIKHKICLQSLGGEANYCDLEVPSGHYFVMGDNRDNSDDSRQWGFVPEHNLIGKAFRIWFSWDSASKRVRWNRIGNVL